MNDSILGSAHLITGSESFLVEREARRLRDLAETESPGLLVNDVDCASLDLGVLGDMTGGSLFSTHTLGIVRELASLDAPVEKALLALVTEPLPELGLIITHAGGQKGRGVVNKLKKAGIAVTECPAIKPWEMATFVSAEARRQKLKLEPRAAEALVDAVGPDARALAAALTQLGSDADGAAIGETLIARYFAGRAEVTSFSVADAVLANRRGPALEQLRWASSTGVPAVLITSALANSLRGLGLYAHHRNSGMRPGELAAAVGVPPFKLKEFGRHLKNWTPGRIATGVRAVARADADIKGAAASSEYTLEQLVIHLTTN